MKEVRTGEGGKGVKERYAQDLWASFGGEGARKKGLNPLE